MNDYLKKWCCLIVFHADQNITEHIISVASTIDCTKHLYYDKEINGHDEWNNLGCEKYLQQANVLGLQMQNAFANAFAKGFRKVVLIKSNFDQVQSSQIIEAFSCLKMIEFCIGPKDHGDYYLLGMNYFEPSLFVNKQWNAPTLIKETIKDIGKLKLALYKLPTLKSEEYVTSVNP